MAPNMETIPCELDRLRHLRLTWRELRDLSRALPDVDPHILLTTLVKDIGTPQGHLANVWALQVLLWAACRWEDPSLTLDQTEGLIDAWLVRRVGTLYDLAALVASAHWIGGTLPLTDEQKNALAEAIVTMQAQLLSTSATGSPAPDTPPTPSD